MLAFADQPGHEEVAAVLGYEGNGRGSQAPPVKPEDGLTRRRDHNRIE